VGDPTEEPVWANTEDKRTTYDSQSVLRRSRVYRDLKARMGAEQLTSLSSQNPDLAARLGADFRQGFQDVFARIGLDVGPKPPDLSVELATGVAHLIANHDEVWATWDGSDDMLINLVVEFSRTVADHAREG
jgi:hypothetical protein